MTTKHRKRRLWSKRRLKLPKPVKGSADKGVSLRLISEADQRFAVVKEMRRRLEQLKDEAGLSTLAEEWLAARAVFMVARIESLEVEAMEGRMIDWGQYTIAVNCLSGVLRKIGITDRKLKKQLNTLEEYVAGKESRREARRRKQKLLQ